MHAAPFSGKMKVRYFGVRSRVDVFSNLDGGSVMNTRQLCLSFCTLMVAALLAGCDDSENPLSTPSKSKPDERLIGTWREVREEGGAFYHVGRLGGKAPESMMRLIIVTRPGEAGEIQPPSQALVFPTNISGNNYLNIAGLSHEGVESARVQGWKDRKIRSFLIMKYELQPDGDRLLVWGMQGSAKIAMIEAERIKGQLKQQDHSTLGRFTDSSENVAKLVADQSERLYDGKPLVLERVK